MFFSRAALLFMLFAVGGGACAAFTSLPAAMPAAADADDFVTTWRVTANDKTITIPVGGAAGAYDIHWGDGAASIGVSGDQSHTYASAGDYAVRISGDFTRIHLAGHDAANAQKLQRIDQWGAIRWSSMESAFAGASSMTYSAPDSPDLSGVSDMSRMFYGASKFNGDLSGWDTSSVTDMSRMFDRTTSFNGDLSTWDTSSVTDMSDMFCDATSFNGDLSTWDTSSVTDMSDMFCEASSFSGDLSGWDVSSVTNMEGMFCEASSFSGDLSGWDVSSVTNMNGMFCGATSFNGNLSGWDVSSVTDMGDMFEDAASFSGDLSAWDTSGVTYMYGMFGGASSFSGDLSGWDTSSVTYMYNMFSGASSFNGDLSNWDVSSVTDMYNMFSGASSFNQPLNSWDVSSVTDMSAMFHDALAFEQNLGNWYIVLSDTSIDYGNAPGTVGRISAQNLFLDGQNPTYGIGPGGDSGSFELNGADLVMKEVPTKDSYTVTVTATFMGDFGSDNSKTFAIDVLGLPSSPFRQVQSGVPVNEVECVGERVLMISPSGMPACVYATSKDTLLQRGFVLAVTYN